MNVGVQMYSLRNYIAREGIEKTLAGVREIGFDCVEPVSDDYGLGIAEVGRLMRKNGLAVHSMHIHYTVFESPDTVKMWQDIFGFETAVIPCVEKEKFYDDNEMRRIIGTANECCGKLGITLAYHNHNFEFEREDALTSLPVRYAPLKLQPDVFWLKAAGITPIDFLKANAQNIALIHLKEFGSRADEPCPVVGKGTTGAKEILGFAASQEHSSIILEYEFPCEDDMTYLKKSFDYINLTNSINYIKEVLDV